MAEHRRGSLSRFGHLEIGDSQSVPAVSEPAAPSPRAGAPGQELTLVIEGAIYRASDPTLPADVRALMDRIAQEGESRELLAQWYRWRAARAQPGNEALPFDGRAAAPPSGGVRGPRVSAIKLDGRVYSSGDPGLPEDVRELFRQLDAQGATPELMRRLRAEGGQVTLHPATTAAPTEGDLQFWREVGGRATGDSAAERPWERWDRIFFASVAGGCGAVWYVHRHYTLFHLIPVAGLVVYLASWTNVKRAQRQERRQGGAVAAAARAQAERYYDAVIGMIGGGQLGPLILLAMAAIVFTYLKMGPPP